MTEQEPMVKFYLSGEMPQRSFMEFVSNLGQRIVDQEVRFGQGKLGFTQDMEREALKEVVTVQAARNFYIHLYQDDTPSPLATVVMQEIARQLGPEEIARDKKGEFTGIARSIWDAEVTKIFDGKSKISYRPGTKRRAFLEAFNAYLPAIPQRPKKKSTKKS